MNIKFLTMIAFAISVSVSTVSCKSNEQTTRNNNTQRNSNQRQGQRLSVDEVFKMMDVNKDNKLSKAEVKGPLANDFASIDTNDDGFITKTELSNAPEPENNRQGGGQGQGGGQRGGGGMR